MIDRALLAAAIIAASVAAAGGSAAGLPERWNGMARVIDGDTIAIGAKRVRIAAIDACERGQTGFRDGREWPCGRIARDRLTSMIGGKPVRCAIVDRDRFGRLVGQCFAGSLDLGLAMVRAGMAETMFRYLPDGHGIALRDYKLAEWWARLRGLGIWSAEIERPQQHRLGSRSPSGATR